MALKPDDTASVSAYASSDPGFEALPVDTLLTNHADLLKRVKLCYGADRPTFDRELMPLVHSYASYVHLLPATADNYFRTPGGLLHLGLETAFFSLQGTDAHIFSGRATISARRELEPRWRLATFIGGLCCELHRTLSQFIVTSASGEEWPAYTRSLSEWLRRERADRYFVRWRAKAAEVRALGLFALPHVVPPEVMQYLCHDNSIIVKQLLATVGGIPQYRDHNVLDGLVRRSLALVIDRNLATNADRYGSPQFGSHLERYLVDAFRRLAIGHSAWIPNREKARVWFGQDGLYLAWPGAAEDVLTLLGDDQLAGIPKAPQTLMDILLEAGVLIAAPGEAQVWTIHPPGSKSPLEAVKLVSPLAILGGTEPLPEPLPSTLTRRPPDRAEQTPPPPKAEPHAVASSATATDSGERDPTKSPQLSLLPPDGPSDLVPEDASQPASPPVRPNAPAAAPAPETATFRLQAPLRLNPVVRDALAQAVHSLNGMPRETTVFTVAHGVFVPLSEFERRGVQPAIAIRSLADTGLLAATQPGAPPTTSREIDGKVTLGVVIAPAFVEGLDPSGFVVAG